MTLQAKDTVIMISPAGRVLNANIDHAVLVLEQWGLEVQLGKYTKSEYYNFAGTIEERLSDLQWALDHPTAKAIFASRGGYGTIQLLDKIDWTLFQQNPKLLIGFSDITNLQASINNLGISSLHALMPNSFIKGDNDHVSLDSLKRALFDANYTLDWVCPVAVNDALISGQIVGGNLSILYSLQGTRYAPNYVDSILFVEEVSEYLYHIDRMLRSMEFAGVFDAVRAIVVGDFSDVKDNDIPFGQSVEEMFLAIAERHGITVVFGFRAGHDNPTLALPLGKETKLLVSNNCCQLSFQ